MHNILVVLKKSLRKVLKQGKDENKFLEVLNVIANGSHSDLFNK